MNIKVKRKAMTLSEILLAVVILAASFLPIIGLMSNSLKITEQDENTQKAAKLCKEKIDIALQMPFDKFDIKTYDSSDADVVSNQLTLNFQDEVSDGITFRSTMKVEKYAVAFHVPIVNYDNYKTNPSSPNTWFTNGNVAFDPIDHRVKRFTVTVTWNDQGRSNTKEYTLTCLKADIR